MNRRAFFDRLLAVPAALTALYTAAAHDAHAVKALRRIKVVAYPYLTDNEAWFLQLADNYKKLSPVWRLIQERDSRERVVLDE